MVKEECSKSVDVLVPCQQKPKQQGRRVVSVWVLMREKYEAAMQKRRMQLDDMMGAAIDALHQQMPIPRMQIWRKSALRFCIQWHGIVATSPAVLPCPCKNVLELRGASGADTPAV